MRSIDFTTSNGMRRKGQRLKSHTHRDGYQKLRFGGAVNKRQYYVHRLVAAAFLGLDIDDTTTKVDHINGDRSDNRVENLRLVSHDQNNHFGGVAYRVLVKQVGKAEADRLIEAHLRCEDEE